MARSLATDAGTDCGSFDFSRIPGSSVDAGAVTRGVDCAFNAQDAGLPFLLMMQFSGADTSSASAYVRTPDGSSFMLGQFYDNCQPAPLQQSSCNGFVPQPIPESESLTDGGLPGIGCADQGASSCLCVKSGC
jgi:hypothetical protein